MSRATKQSVVIKQVCRTATVKKYLATADAIAIVVITTSITAN